MDFVLCSGRREIGTSLCGVSRVRTHGCTKPTKFIVRESSFNYINEISLN